MGKLSRVLKDHSEKRDNSPAALRAKVQIRQHVLNAIGADLAHVFDAFAGDGHMHREVWKQAAGYVGCDLRFFPDDRECFVADNCRVMRTIDLRPFNVVDLDAYGSPWDQLFILAARRPLTAGEHLGVVLTDGTAFKLKTGGLPHTLAHLARASVRQPGLGSAEAQGQIINRALLRVAAMLRGRIARRWEAAGKTGSHILYIGLVFEAI